MHTAHTLRSHIRDFIQKRLQAKLDKLRDDQLEERAKCEDSFRPENWLAEAARRVSQLQLASHILKATHPDARGTNLRVVSMSMSKPGLLGTHSVAGDAPDDVVGNAAALDVFKFLCLQHEGRSLLDLALARDPALMEALSDEPERSAEWCDAFASIAQDNSPPASHTLAKQVYFPLPDGSYHLLAPLFPTSLVHVAQRLMREDRFGEAPKAAREARRKGETFSRGFREYPDLAIRKIGGTKPQNISQLNSERYGENWLLSSLPPNWQSSNVRPPWSADSVFDSWFGRQRRVKDLTRRLRTFLENTSRNNVGIRRHRAALVEEICDEAHQYAASLRQLPPGWSADPRCRLHEVERLWLDPLRVHTDEDFAERRYRPDWPSVASHRFGNWLNTVLVSKKMVLGEDEQHQWKRDLLKELNVFREMLEEDRDDS